MIRGVDADPDGWMLWVDGHWDKDAWAWAVAAYFGPFDSREQAETFRDTVTFREGMSQVWPYYAPSVLHRVADAAEDQGVTP